MTGTQTEWVSKLHREGRFLIDTSFDRECLGPRNLVLDGQIFYRFMDYFYLPQPMCDLQPEQVLYLCDLRNKYYDKVVDLTFNTEVTRYMADRMAKLGSVAQSDVVRILDFGCGNGTSTRTLGCELPRAYVAGVDASSKAVELALANGVVASHVPLGRPFPFTDGFFQIVAAVFVMHFSVDMDALNEICRVLVHDGLFVFNNYGPQSTHLRSSLVDAGFREVERHLLDSSNDGHAVSVWKKAAPDR